MGRASNVAAALGASTGPTTWPPAPRASLPSLPGFTDAQPVPPVASCWAQGPYRTAAPPVPTKPDVRFHRGNFCGMRVPGLTEGGLSADPTLTMTWDWTRYSAEGLQLSIAQTLACGYTHVVLSRPQCLNQGTTIADLLRVALSCKAAGLFVIIVAVSDGDSFDAAVPWLDQLHAAGAVDIICLCWQADRYYSPYALVNLATDGAAWAHPRNLLVTIHWLNEACAWWNPEDDPTDPNTCRIWGICNRFDYQRVMANRVDGHYAQANTEAPIDALQAWIAKILVSLQANQFLVASELDAQAQFDDPQHRLELYGDQKGYLCCCTAPNVSYLNGARRWNGAVL